MNFLKFPIHQSIIRVFLHNGEEREYCGRRLYLTKITKEFKEPPSEPMLYGKYFETQVLGKSTGYNVHDMPRKKLTKKMEAENAVRRKEGRPELKGEKYLDQIRVDDQIERFKAQTKAFQIMVNNHNVQVPITTYWDQDPDVLLKAELDVFPTTILWQGELNAAIIDLKLTTDIHATWGEFCYGTPEYLDLIQAKMYHYVVRNIDDKLNPHLDSILTKSVRNLIEKDQIRFLLWIFNYKKDLLEDKFIDVKWEPKKEQELHESIRKTISALEFGEKNDWPTNPQYHLCKDCPWVSCPDKIKHQTL